MWGFKSIQHKEMLWMFTPWKKVIGCVSIYKPPIFNNGQNSQSIFNFEMLIAFFQLQTSFKPYTGYKTTG